MAFPTSATLVPLGVAPALAGITLGVYPSTNLSVTEVQRATAASAASSLWATVWNVEASSAYEVTFTDRMPLSTRSFFYKARHKRVGFSNSAFTNIVSGKPIAMGDIIQAKPVSGAAAAPIAFGHSTPANAQASIIPVPADAGIFAYNVGGGTTPHMWACLSVAADFTLRRADGSTMSAYATSTYDRPAAPTLSQVASGALGARTRFVRIAFAKLEGSGSTALVTAYRVSTESSLAINANNLLKVTAPAAVAGYDGYVVLVGTLTNTEVFQQVMAGVSSAVVAFGTDWTEPVGGAPTSSTTNTPYNAVMDSGFTMAELTQSVTLLAYVMWDITMGSGGVGTTGVYRLATPFTTTASTAAAQQQNRDAMVPLSFGPTVSVVVPAAGGSGSGSGTSSHSKYL